MVATKLAHPFEEDLQRKKPTSLKDPAILNLDWNFWTSVVKSEDRGVKKAKGLGGLVKGKEIEVKEEDAFRFNGKELDDYLEWYQKTFLDGTDEEQKSEFAILSTVSKFFLSNILTTDPSSSLSTAPPIPRTWIPLINKFSISRPSRPPTPPPSPSKNQSHSKIPKIPAANLAS